MKDNFSAQSDLYAKYRPHYPVALYDYLYDKIKSFDKAWDCGTGNGQVAQQLAKRFNRVFATDISQNQLNNAYKSRYIDYLLCPAEHTSIPDHSIQLITVAQAIHWFDPEAFFKEVERVSAPDGLLSYWGYGLLKINRSIDPILQEFHDELLGDYWDPERKILTDEYKAISFPLSGFEKKTFNYRTSLTPELLEGYLNTWSSVQKYMQTHRQSPVPAIMEKIKPLWTGGTVRFPIFIFSGRVH